ncbi:ABC transporter ATP-binding protein [Haloferacaceae archaeon DSL9]
MTEPLLSATVTKAFGSETVLSAAALDVAVGELVVVLGENGAGKSVFLSCLAGSRPPSAGTVTLDGVLLEARTDAPIAYLPQGSIAIGGLTGRETMEFYAATDPRMTDRWRDYVEQFELTDELDAVVDTYSGGTRRKLELAIVLSIDAPVYILDEPTAGLDLSAITAMHAAIRDRRNRGRTIIVSSHLPVDVELGDRVAILRDGEIAVAAALSALCDGVPPVVTASAGQRRAVETIRERVLDGRLFDDGTTCRGYLDPSESVSSVTTVDGVRTTAPTLVDVFNYYVRLGAAGV